MRTPGSGWTCSTRPPCPSTGAGSRQTPGAPDTATAAPARRGAARARGAAEGSSAAVAHPGSHLAAGEGARRRRGGRAAGRITREASDFAGLIEQWDAINETVILPEFTAEENAVTRLARARGRMHVIRLAFETARAADPHARLVLNDFDLSSDFEDVIEECLEAGLEIDAIGLQTHMHQGYRGEAQIAEVIERFSRFDLPIQLTETTLLSGELMPAHVVDLNDHVVDSWPSTPEGEARQADELVRHYRTVLAQPAVESLTYWGLGDAGAWLGAPGRPGARRRHPQAGLRRAPGAPPRGVVGAGPGAAHRRRGRPGGAGLRRGLSARAGRAGRRVHDPSRWWGAAAGASSPGCSGLTAGATNCSVKHLGHGPLRDPQRVHQQRRGDQQQELADRAGRRRGSAPPGRAAPAWTAASSAA